MSGPGSVLNTMTLGATDALGITGSDGIFGDAPTVRNVTPREINLPGLGLRRNGRTFDVQRGGEVTPLIEGIQRARAGQAGTLRDAAGEISPAIGRLTDARRGIVQAERRRTMGDLREQLGRRRILGSSFGADVMARAGAEFAVQEAELQAEGELREMFAETELLGRATEAEVSGLQTALQQIGLETQIGAQLITNITGANQSVQMANAQLAQAHAQGQGEFIGSIIGAGAALLGGGA